jgi:hypothetical protein
MEFLAIYFSLLVCPDTIVINKSKLEWNSVDYKNMLVAKSRCVEHYPEAPCLVVFTKTGFQSYRAICGEIR